MKRILLLILTTVGLFGATATGVNLGGANSAAGTNATMVATPCVFESLTLYSTNQTPTIVYILDGFYFKTNSAYTNWVVYATNEVTSYITTTGITNAMTNTVIKSVANPVAATTTPTTSPATITTIIPGAPSGGVGLVTVPGGISFGYRATITNSLPGTSYILTYRSP